MSVYTNITVTNENNEEVVIKKLKLDYQNGILNVYHVVTKEDESEEEILSLVQPWKCHNDGSRSDFVNEQDSYDWFETVKTVLG